MGRANTAILLSAALLLWTRAAWAPPLIHHVQIRGVPFELEVAADPLSRAQGLSGRRELPARGGMLFVFPDDVPRTFWMRDCLMPIGLVFLDRNGQVVAMHEMSVERPRQPDESERAYQARLRLYPSVAPARYAIELRSGMIDALRLVRGERIDLRGVPAAIR